MRTIATPYLIAGGAVALALLWFARQGASKAGQQAGLAVVDLADGVVTGVVTGIGDRVGIPRTDTNECAKAKADGRTWDASFVCPAGEFLKYLWS